MKTKTKFNKLTAWLLTLAMLMTFMPFMTFTAYAARVNQQDVADIWVGTNHILDHNTWQEEIKIQIGNFEPSVTYLDHYEVLIPENLPGGVQVSYDRFNKEATLTITDLNIVMNSDYAKFHDSVMSPIYATGLNKLNIVIVGDNTFETTWPYGTYYSSLNSIYSDCPVTFSGSGSLTCKVYSTQDTLDDARGISSYSFANSSGDSVTLKDSANITIELSGNIETSIGVLGYVTVMDNACLKIINDTRNTLVSYGVLGGVTVDGGTLDINLSAYAEDYVWGVSGNMNFQSGTATIQAKTTDSDGEQHKIIRGITLAKGTTVTGSTDMSDTNATTWSLRHNFSYINTGDAVSVKCTAGHDCDYSNPVELVSITADSQSTTSVYIVGYTGAKLTKNEELLSKFNISCGEFKYYKDGGSEPCAPKDGGLYRADAVITLKDGTTHTISDTFYVLRYTSLPNASFNDPKLTNLAAGATYSITVDEKENSYIADQDGTITIDEKWYGKSIRIVRKTANPETHLDSMPQTLSIPLHSHTGGFATCSNLAECEICHEEYGDLDSEMHAPATEWIFENGKHYHECLYGCDAHLDEAECSGERATCLAAAVCDVCSNTYEDINPDNHARDDVYYKKLSNDVHGVYYTCCEELKTEEAHTESISATCGGNAYCSVCGSPYGYYDSSNHTGELEYIVESNTTHSQKWTCCKVYEQRYVSHKLSYSANEESDIISAYCTDCHAEGYVKMTMDDGVYNGYAFKATAEKSGIFDGWAPAYPEFTYCCEGGCKTAGTHTATMALGDKTISKEFHIDQKPLDFQYIRCHTKQYDGTRNATISGAKLNGIVIYSKGADVFADYDDVTDDVSINWETLSVLLPGSDIGYYETVDASGIILEGADKDNYTIPESIPGVTLQDNYGWEYSIHYIPLSIELKNQTVHGESELDQNAYTIDPEDRFEVSGIELYDDGYGKVDADISNIKVMHNGEDWTEYVECTVYTANLLKVCEGHSTDENGFCSTGNCNAYDVPMLITETDEYGNDNSFYMIKNAGQLYWFAEQVNVYHNNYINARLVKDIYVNNDLTAENLREWTPIGGRYSSYTGKFDGNGYSISGLYFDKPDADYVGLFGSTDYGYTIKNIHIKNSYFKGNNCVGALCGYAGSYISNCTASADVTVSGNSDVGGLVGSSSYGELKNCYSLAAVVSDGLVGGLVGRNCLAISNCYTNQNSIYGYNDSNYGGSVENSYYLSEEETEDSGKTAVQFENGEVAYLLQKGQVGDPLWDEENEDYVYDDDGNYIYGEAPHIWGQTIGIDDYPVLGGEKVMFADGVYYNEIAEFEILSNDKDVGKATATVAIPHAGTYTLIFADYSESRLNKVDSVTVTTERDNKVITVLSKSDITLGTGDKIMLWQDMTNPVPLCDAYIVK